MMRDWSRFYGLKGPRDRPIEAQPSSKLADLSGRFLQIETRCASRAKKGYPYEYWAKTATPARRVLEIPDSRLKILISNRPTAGPNRALTPRQRFGTSVTSNRSRIMQPTFRPHRKKRARKIGYRARMATKGGRKVIKARRLKGRKRLTVV